MELGVLIVLTVVAVFFGMSGQRFVGTFARLAPTPAAARRFHLLLLLVEILLLGVVWFAAHVAPLLVSVLGPAVAYISGLTLTALDDGDDDDHDGVHGRAERMAPHLPPGADALGVAKVHLWGLAVQNLVWIAALFVPGLLLAQAQGQA